MNDVSPVVREIRLAREAAGFTQEQLAEKMGVSASLVNKVEGGVAPASPMYVKQANQALPPAPGVFERMHADGLGRKVIGDWLRDWLVIEQQADTIRWFEPNVVPGLLQTEGYARTILPTDNPDETEPRLALRMGRQEVLARERPPAAVAIVDESVLHRRVGDAQVMHDQLVRLATTPAVVQVLPTDTDTYVGLNGPFVLATVGERMYVYVDTPAEGYTREDREVVSRVQHYWDILRGEALPPRQSHDLILKVAESWKTSST